MSTSSALEFIPTQGELSVVAAIVQYAQTTSGPLPSPGGVAQVDVDVLVHILQRSGLSNEDLGAIWSISDEDGDGNLSERELAIAVRLIGWAQSGEPVNPSFLHYSNGPLPTLKDVWEHNWDNEPAPIQFPPVNLFDKIEFRRAFREAGPVNNELDGNKVRDVFLKTNLSFDQLDQIWNLVDTEQRGSLNNIEFAVGMYLIQAIKTCQLTTLPASIPQHIYDQFSVKSSSPFAAPSPRPAPRSDPLPWKSPSSSFKSAVTQSTPTNNDRWDVSVIEQAEANGHFDTLDTDQTGLIDGDESARYMLKFFKLPPSDVATIWDLVDLRRDNKLNKDQLAVAVHLIHRKLEGSELPSLELPASLIPPPMRTKAPFFMRRASAPPVPQKKPPPPPPQSRKPSLSVSRSTPSSPTATLKRTTSFSPTAPSNVRIPRTLGSDLRNRFSIAVIPETQSPPPVVPNSIRGVLKRSPTTPSRPPPAAPTTPFSVPPVPSFSPPSRPPPVVSTPSFSVPPAPSFSASPSRPPPAPPSPSPPLPPVPLPQPSPKPSHATPPTITHTNSIDQEAMAEMRAETKQLRSHIEELMAQLKSQNHYRDRNDELTKENKHFKKRFQELEVAMSQVLQANEGSDRTDELTREVVHLTQLLSGHESTQAELQETLHSMSVLSQDNETLKQSFEDLKVEKTSVEKELRETREKMDQLQVEKNSFATRLKEMEKLLADPQTKGNSKRELQMLLKDVTKENETLKRRERETQDQMSSLLLTSRNQAEMDDLRRENSRLKRDIQELEDVVHKMQASNSDNQLHRRIGELQREKEQLNSQVVEMASRVAGVEELGRRRVEELERRCRELEVTNQTLQHQQSRSASHDANAPPPAYELVATRT